MDAGKLKWAMDLQKMLAQKVVLEDGLLDLPERIGGADVAYVKREGRTLAIACLVVLDRKTWTVQEERVAFLDVFFPYIPGFLSFRELPSLCEAYNQLSTHPDLWFVDGAGWAHPRRFGLACHFGTTFDVPTIGVAKSRLVGNFPPLPEEKGSMVPLLVEGKQVGIVLRTRTATKPLFVSPGHRVSIETAAQWTLACCGPTRIPIPTREAHLRVTRTRKQLLSGSLRFPMIRSNEE